ncbi:MAG: helix-turn-helix transcriptional regulator [Oscillospiraceae bacterium]|nr:helix-turn-helix transcriptional regulator [Oscillospiraceae bacterium]
MFKLKTSSGKNNITGYKLSLIRKQRTISQRQLAKMMQLSGYDVDHHFIRRIENGERFVTDIELLALSRVLNIPITELIDESSSINVSTEDGNS